MEQIKKAIQFITEKHVGQIRRDSKLPYITHPINVMNRLISHNITDVDILVAALLHDTLEDTDTTYDEIADIFNDDIAELVHELTNDPNITKADKLQYQLTKIPTISCEAQLIKIADKIDNVLDFLLNCNDSERIKNYINNTTELMEKIKDTHHGLYLEYKNIINLEKNKTRL